MSDTETAATGTQAPAVTQGLGNSAGSAGGGAGASQPSAVAGSGANAPTPQAGNKATAQPRERYREAARRLIAGESPDQIRGGDVKTTPGQADSPAGTPASDAATAGSDPDAMKLEASNLGLSDAELVQLKRSPLHAKALQMIPPSNRKAIARQFLEDAKALSADKDRAHQALAGKEKKPAGDGAGGTEDPAGQGQATDTSAAGQAAGGDPSQTQTQTEVTSKRSVNPIEALEGFKKSFALSEQTYSTLSSALGEDYAKSEKASREASIGQLEGILRPLMNAVGMLARERADGLFDRELEGLAKNPVYADLARDPAKRTALRAETDAFVRASGELDIAKAVRRAAASLFSVDIEQAALVHAATARTQTVRGGIHSNPGDGSVRKPLTGRARYEAAAAYMQQHPKADADEVRNALATA